MNNIICITVSTNYSDLLDIILPQNYKFFKKWYIITYEKDIDTINIINKYNFDNIEILYFDFYNNCNFNKGGAIRMAQQIIYNNYNSNDNILILDSDIYLPSDFNELLKNITINNDILYGTVKRLDYSTLIDFNYNIKYNEYKGGDMFYGFFQLYKLNSNYLYDNSFNAGVCDHNFKLLFKTHSHIPNLIVKHLGKPNINWDGRKSRLDFK
jgi:hypothetical protein